MALQSPGGVGMPVAPGHGIDFQGVELHACQGFVEEPGHDGIDDHGEPMGLGKPKGDAPGIEGIPGIDGMPGMVDIPGIVVMPGQEGIPGIVDIPGIDGIPPPVLPGIMEDQPPAASEAGRAWRPRSTSPIASIAPIMASSIVSPFCDSSAAQVTVGAMTSASAACAIQRLFMFVVPWDGGRRAAMGRPKNGGSGCSSVG
jgi:integrin beta 8